MSEFDFLSQVTIGQYLPGDSLPHRLDPRAKLLMALAWILALIVCRSLAGMAFAGLAVAAGLWMVRVPARFALRSVWKALPFLLLLALLQVLVMPANRTGETLWQWWIVTVTTGGLLAGALLIARFVALILAISLLSFTTGTTALMHGLEHLLRPLQRLGLPAHELALTFDIALRSVPLLAQEAERLAKAQASRGGEFGGARGGPIRRAQQVLPLVVPLFLGALQRAERLAVAMEARGYVGGRGRTQLVALSMRPTDWLALFIVAALAIVIARV